MLIDGIHIPLTTPFTRDGALYLRKLAHNVGRYSLSPAAGFVALTGEGSALSDQETQDVLRVICETADPAKVLIASISRGSVRNALVMAGQAAEAGFDAVILRAPNDWESLTAPELLLFFRAVADSSLLPVILWSDANWPDLSWSEESVAKLAGHPNIIGLYDTALSVDRHKALAEATREVRHQVTVTTIFAPVTRRMLAAASASTVLSASSLAEGTATLVAPTSGALKTRVKTVGFQIMAAGSSIALGDLLAAGASGAMPDLAAAAPQGCYEAYAAFKDGDLALSSEKEHRLIEADKLMAKLGIAGIKFGCDLNGYYGGAPRLPRLPLAGTQRTEVENVLSILRN